MTLFSIYIYPEEQQTSIWERKKGVALEGSEGFIQFVYMNIVWGANLLILQGGGGGGEKEEKENLLLALSLVNSS